MTENDQIIGITRIFEQFKEGMEAALKPKPEPKCEDYREPWNLDDHSGIKDNSGEFAFCPSNGKSDGRKQRACDCVNSMQGVPDPAAFVARAKEVREHLARMPIEVVYDYGWNWTESSGNVVTWLRRAAELCKEAV